MIQRVNNREQILFLWQEAFGDPAEEIEFFLDHGKPYQCFGNYDGERLTAMLFLLDCYVGGKKYHYIYAACTLKEYRQRGNMTRLLQFCKDNRRPLCLIPATDRLKTYYINRGFTRKVSIEDVVFRQTQDIVEYLLDGYQLKEPEALIYEGE